MYACCETCRFWREDAKNGAWGQCCRRAPAAVHSLGGNQAPTMLAVLITVLARRNDALDDVALSDAWECGVDAARQLESEFPARWPETKEDDWCGEWEEPPDGQRPEPRHPRRMTGVE
jgi:hypothetical protein